MNTNRWQWRRLRKGAQLFCLLLFFFLFIKTDYAGRDEIPYAVNLLFRIDPLLALCASLASRTAIALMGWSLIVLALTFLFGRFFCGWVCPMGTLLDGCHRSIRPRGSGTEKNFGSLKYFLLLFLLGGALFGLPVAGYFDPFSILVRGLAVAVYPALNALTTTFFTFTYQSMPAWVNSVTEPAYAFLKATVLPFRQHYFELTILSAAILLTVFLLERLGRRFFCRNVCPLGALFALVARFSLLRGRTGKKCGKCRNCRDVCRMGAIDEECRISPLSCNLCMDCVDLCPGNKIAFSFAREPGEAPFFSISRRSLLGSFAIGATLPFFLKTRALGRRADPYLIRPPGALAEEEFLGRCVRCGECMKVCIGNALQPTFLAAGIEGMFAPRLMARLGYCEYNCTLCGQVCPTGAIRKLALTEKQKTKIGHAFFDKNRCLPYAKGIPCMVCEEHCPTADKAIQFREAEVVTDRNEKVSARQPYIVDERCIGCGICESKCPLPGVAAVRVTSAGESRNPDHSLPISGGFYQ